MDRSIANKSTTCIQARIRRALLRVPLLSQKLQAGRAILRFGPWSHAARAIIRRYRPPHNGPAGETSRPLQLSVSQLAHALRVDGMAVANDLPQDLLTHIRAVTDELPPGEYGDFHEHPDVRAIVQCLDVLSVVRSYLGAEPELLECNVVVAHPESAGSPKIGSQRLFHFDYAGWHSLNLFVYLTDVEEGSGAHQVVAGTHCSRNMRDAIRPSIPDEEIMARYAGRIRTITGRAGTMFFEDTTAFHRRLLVRRRRVLLNVLYASHRSWLSKGRLIPKYSDYLRRAGTKASILGPAGKDTLH